MVDALIQRSRFVFLLSFLLFGVARFSIAAEPVEKPLVLALGPRSEAFFTAFNAMHKDLEAEFRVEFRECAEGSSYDAFERHLETLKPKLLVLLDNQSISHYRAYQKKYADRGNFPPAIAAMSLFVRQSIQGMENTTSIGYQMPIPICIAPLKVLLDKPIRKVGVIYRKQHRPFFERQQALLKEIEGIELVGREIESLRNLNRNLRRELNYLIKKENIDVLWIPNDNELILGEDALVDVWLPKLRTFKKPVIVNVPTLMEAPLDIGTIAVLPDNTEIGLQLAQKIVRIRDGGWQVQDEFEDAYSRYTIFNLGFAKRFLKFKEDKISEIVDKIIE